MTIAAGALSAGARMFARYAYPPNALGYCGPEDASVLLQDPGTTDERIARHARQFEGAWAYLELIAASAQIDDPLDPGVVEAYWVGNDLLDGIEPDALVTQLRARFPGQAGATWTPGRAHHSYHVFAVYPWAGLLARGVGNGAPLNVLQQCRIRWGEVVALDGDRARIRSQPLVQRDGALELGPPREESAAWSVDGHTLLRPPGGADPSRITAGEIVAVHWGWVCDVLRPAQAAELEARTLAQLVRTNDALRATSQRL